MKPLCILTIMLCLPSSAIAHSDPLGDVHPEVRVENGQFAVYFQDNRNPKEEPIEGEPGAVRLVSPYYKMTVTPTGEILKPRETSQPQTEVRLPIEISGFNRPIIGRVNDKFYVVPRSTFDHCGTPYMYELEDRSISKIRFWDTKARVSSIHRALVSKATVAVVATKESEIPPEKRGPNFQYGPFTLFLFTRVDSDGIMTWEHTAQQDFGLPQRIYFSPITSELLSIGKYYYLAWLEKREGSSYLKLTRWNPIHTLCDNRPCEQEASMGGEIRTVELGETDWNVSISMNHMADDLLIAYHESGQIKLIHADVDKRFERDFAQPVNNTGERTRGLAGTE